MSLKISPSQVVTPHPGLVSSHSVNTHCFEASVPCYLGQVTPKLCDKRWGPMSLVKTRKVPGALFHTPTSTTLQRGGQRTSATAMSQAAESILRPSGPGAPGELSASFPGAGLRVNRAHGGWKYPVLRRPGGSSKHLQILKGKKKNGEARIGHTGNAHTENCPRSEWSVGGQR